MHRLLGTGRSLALALTASFVVLSSPAAAQAGSRDFVCAFLWDHGSKTFFIGRDLIEVRSDHPHNSSNLEHSVPTQFHGRVASQISRDDLLAYSTGGYFSWGLSQQVIRQSLAEARQECVRMIERARVEGFDVYGVGAPIYTPSDAGEQTRSHSFLSVLEYPNYLAGTIAENKRRAERGESRQRPRTDVRDAQGWRPGEYERYFAEMQERGRRITAQADSLYDAGQFAAARVKYRQLLNIGVPEYARFTAHASERVRTIDELAGIRAYSAFNQATGISFGAYGSQSYFDRDSHLMGLSVAKRTLGLNAFYGIATGSDGIRAALGNEDESVVGEYTRYQLMAGSAIPGLRLGPFGLHAAYIFQQTDRRALHLGMAGVHMGNFGVGPTVHIDVTQVYGKPHFGFGVDLNFNDIGG